MLGALKFTFIEKYKEYGVIFIRLIIGFHLIYGTQDNIFSYARMEEFAAFLSARGVPFPLFSAFLSAYAQFICGILIVVGAATRFAAAVMMVNFIAALTIAHIGDTYPNSFPALMMLAAACFLFVHGAGRLSVDSRMTSTRPRYIVKHLKLIALLFTLAVQSEQVLAHPNLRLNVQTNISRRASDSQSKLAVAGLVSPQVDKKARYLIYLSGYIVHAGNLRPTSPKFGTYEYEKILERFKQSGFVVISEARRQSSELEPYATTVAHQVNRLLKAGVPPQQITVVGASQGAWIAMLTSTHVKNQSLNFVLLGSCAADDGLLKIVNLHGNVLFISERTDLPGSCERFRGDATGLSEYKFLEINTGQKHGFLFRPLEEWIAPTIDWAERKSITKR